MLKYIIALIGIIVLASQVGCRMMLPVRTSVNALADINAVYPKDYILLHADESVNTNDLEFVEYSRYLNKVLADQGFVLAPQQTPDTIVIVLDYGIGDPELRREAYSIPVWGQTGYSSSTTYGSTSTRGRFYDDGNDVGYSGRTNSRSTTIYKPKYGVTGYRTGVKEYTTYTRYFDIAAYQRDDETGSAVELWRVLSTSEGKTGDLRTIVPYMLTAMKPYIGKNTPAGEVVVTKRGNDRETNALISADPVGIE